MALGQQPDFKQLYLQAKQQEDAQAAVAEQQRLADEQAARELAAQQAAEAERNRSRTWGEVAGDTGAAALQSAVGLGGAAYGLANLATLGNLDRATGFSQNLAETQDIVEGWKSAPLQARKQEMAAAFKNEGVLSGLGTVVSNPSLLADLGVQSAAYLIPGAAAARAAGSMALAGAAAKGLSGAVQAHRAQKAATAASLVSQAAMTGGYMNVDSINAADKAGMSENETQLAGIAGGVTGALVNTAITKLTGAGGLEAMAANRLGGAALPGVAGGVVTNVAKGVAKEGTEEALQEANEQVIRNAAGGQELGTDVAQNAALGGLLGGTLGGVMGAMSPRQPSMARDEAAKMQKEVEREIAKYDYDQGVAAGTITPGVELTESVLRDSPLSGIIRSRDDMRVNFAGEQLDLAGTPLSDLGATYAAAPEMPAPTQEVVENPNQFDMFAGETLSDEDMGVPLEGALPEVKELSGARAIVAARQARMASQPPRAQVVEQPVEEVTIDTLPQPEVATRNLDDVYRETAPIGGVAQRFGIEVAAQEAARRAALAPTGTTEAPAPAALPQINMADTKTAKQFRGAVRQAFKDAGVQGSPQGPEFDAIVSEIAKAGVRPGDERFNEVVGTAAARLAADKTRKGGKPTLSGVLVDLYPTTLDQRADAAFDREGAPTTEEELFGPAPTPTDAPAPVAAAPAPTVRPTIPADQAPAIEKGQRWVNPEGVEYEVRGVMGGKAVLVPTETGKGGAKNLPRSTMNEAKWQMVGELPPAAPRQAPAQPNPETLLSFLSKRGGINLDEQLTTLGDTGKQANKGYREGKLFRKGGDGMDSIAIAMHEAGYLTDAQFNSPTDNGGMNAAREMIARAFDGEKIYAMESEAYQKQLADQAAVSPDLDGPAYDAYVAQPGAPLMQTAVEQQAAHGSLMPVFDGAVAAVDLAENSEEAGNAVRAARAHPAYLQMTEAQQLQYEAHFAAVLQSLTGIKFHLAGAMPKSQTDTPAFKAWFGSSKVVDSNGKPLVVYHGTTNGGFTEFKPFNRKGEQLGFGVHFAEDAEFADRYANDPDVVRKGKRPEVYEAYLSIKNPLLANTIVSEGSVEFALAKKLAGRNFFSVKDENGVPSVYLQNAIDAAPAKKAEQLIREAGFDGIRYESKIGSRTIGGMSTSSKSVSWVAFEPTQIKSAIGNRGTFDPANPDIRFRTKQGDAGTGVDAAAFNAMAARAKQTLGVDVLTHEDAAAAAAAIGMEVPTSAAGFFYNGAIHLIRANNATKKDLAFTIAHEAGHSGMAKLLGQSLDAAMNRMWANAEMRKRIKTVLAGNPKMTRQIAAEEVLADMLAANEKLNSSVMAKLYNGVRNFFARLVGIRDLVVTNQEIDRLLSDVALVNKGHVPQHVVPGGMDYDLWVNNAASATAQNPKFSKARYDMDAMLQAAANETERPDNILAFSGIAKAIQTAAGDTAKSVWSALKEGKLGEMYMHNFMSLDHLVDHYDKLFGGRIKKYARLREQKEAQFNRLNARENFLAYKSVLNGETKWIDLGNQSVNELTEEWDGYKRANPAKAVSLDYVLSEGTYYQIFPERSWEDQVHSGFDYEGKGYDEAERRAAYDKISAAWNTLGEQGKRIYMKSQAIYGTRHTEHYQAIVAEAERRGTRAAEQARARGGDGDVVAARIEAAVKRYKQQMATMMGKMQQGPYSPLQRFGDYFVVVQNDKGETVHLSAYDNRADQEAAAKEIAEARKKAGENVVVSTTMTKDQAFDATGVPKDQIESIRREVIDMLPDTMDADARAAAVESLTSGLAEMYLQSLPAKSFAKHSIQRKNIAGYDDNALRAFANYTIRSARSVAGIQYDGQIANALTDVQNYVDDTRQGKYSTAEGVKEIDTNKLQNVANAVKNQYKQSQNLTQNKIADTLTAAAFTYQLTSPSQMFMNATQVMFVTFPELAAKYGAKQAAAELNRAAKQYFQSGFDMLNTEQGKAVLRNSADPTDSALLQALTRIKENGPLDITQAHDVSGVADGSAGQLSPYWGKTMKVLSFAMHKSEVFNRQITAAAAIRMEMGKMAAEGKKLLDADGKLTAEAEARLVGIGQDTITSTQFNYAQYAKPPVMQGPVGKVVMQYKMYQLAMLSLLSRNIKSAEFGRMLTGKPAISKEDAKIARETLSWMLGMQVALTGTAGTIIAPFAFALADMFKDDDLTSSKQDYVNAVGKYVAHGVLAGLIDTSRIEAATLIPILGQRDYAPVEGRPADTFTYYVAQNLGPSFGLTRNLYTGVSELGNGNYEKGIQLLLPKPFADLHASYFDGANGVRNSKDIIYYEPSPFDIALNLVGLRSGERREAELRRQTFNAVQTRQFAVRDRYLGRLALAYQGGDGGEIQDAMADIQSWNQRYPDMPIVGQEMRKAIVSRFRTQSVASQTGLPTSRMPGQTIDAVLGR